MTVPVAALAKLAAAALSNEDTRRKLGWIVAAICSPLILTLALICSLLSGSAEHNNSAVLLCFNGGSIPNKTPAEYVAYIEDMRRSFTLLDSAIDAVNDMTEDSDSLDGIRVKAVFYAIFFGEDAPSRRAHKRFVDCFVTYEERTRTVTGEDGTETEESYTVAIPIADIAAVYRITAYAGKLRQLRNRPAAPPALLLNRVRETLTLEVIFSASCHTASPSNERTLQMICALNALPLYASRYVA